MSKKFTLLFFVFVSLLNFGFTQSAQTENKIKLYTITPENIDNLDNSQLSRINSKFSDIITQSGYSGDGLTNNPFVVYPKILVNEVKESDGGMFRIFSASIDITIVVLQYNTKTIFKSITLELKGSGDSKRLAIDNAIRSMKTNSNELNSFFVDVRKKIIDYFVANCDNIIKKGELLISQKNYPEAFSTYFTIPSEVACFEKVSPLIVSAFKQYQNSKCLELLQNAKARFGSRDFAGALSILSKIDPESKCNAEANKLINECFKNVSEEESRNFEFLKEAYRTEKNLEGRRIDAARDISIEYYRSRPSVINYNSLILF